MASYHTQVNRIKLVLSRNDQLCFQIITNLIETNLLLLIEKTLRTLIYIEVGSIRKLKTRLHQTKGIINKENILKSLNY